jgi:hypothetical protein
MGDWISCRTPLRPVGELAAVILDIPSETWESPGVAVQPASLYIEQLRERLGDSALRNIGYQ